MRIVVDLNRCQSYGQCVFAAPEVFRFRGEESLEYDHAPGAASDAAVRRAALACPVQAITLHAATEEIALPGGAPMSPRVAEHRALRVSPMPGPGAGADEGAGGTRSRLGRGTPDVTGPDGRGIERRDANGHAGR